MSVNFEFYIVELARLASGEILVSLTATTLDNEQPGLLNQDIVSDRVRTIDEALAIVKASVSLN